MKVEIWKRCMMPLQHRGDFTTRCDKPLELWPDKSWRCQPEGHFNDEGTLRREALGRAVHEVWIVWARDQDSTEHYSAPWEEMEEKYREARRRIGEHLAGIRDWRVGQRPGNRIP